MKDLVFSLLKGILKIFLLVVTIFSTYEYSTVRGKGYPREMHLMDCQYRIIPIHLIGITPRIYMPLVETQSAFLSAKLKTYT